MLENLYSLQSTWMWVGTAKAEPHVVCINCSFKHKLHYYSYIQQRIFSIKRKRRQKSWFIFPLHRNCNISLWLFPPLSEEISAIKIAISASKCLIQHFEALFILFILHIAGRMSPHIWILFAYIYLSQTVILSTVCLMMKPFCAFGTASLLFSVIFD